MKKIVSILMVLMIGIVLVGCSDSDEAGYYAPSDPVMNEDVDGVAGNDDTQTYSITENPQVLTTEQSTSTFSIDVDTASYSNFRRYINNGQKPYVDGIRTEELVNYFDYNYLSPLGDVPFSITTELADSPWNEDSDLLMIGIQAEEIEYEETPTNNLVFLVDVSGSMNNTEKIGMAKESFKLLVENLREEDYVSIVTYASTAEVVLTQTPGNQKDTINAAIDSLAAGGSTNGSGGIELAYDLVYENFVFGGNNRVIMATDGDFNVGTTSGSSLADMVQEKAEIGIFLTILSFGGSNYGQGTMEELSNKGQGNYFYIDNLTEANKVLNVDISATIVAIAEDVKVQIEFNSDIVESYRLIGYENRVLSNDDFDDDDVDAGEIGAGHNVTAFYEITYKEGYSSGDLATVRVRYKDIGEEDSQLVEGTVETEDHTDTPTNRFLFASSIVEVSLVLRDSDYAGNASYEHALSIIADNIGEDPYGLRQEFYDLVVLLKDIDSN